MLPNPPQSRSANGLNQYLAINSNAITHDANGNLQSDGLWAYSHDLDNRLVNAVRNNPASGVSLGYDPAGRLSRTVVDNQITDFLYDGTDLIAEYDGAGNLTTRHIHGPGVDAPLVSITGTTKTWRYADHLGSVIAEADAAGNAVAIRGYGPFGENGSTAPNRFGYTGQQYIAGLGLYYYKARWYSPTMGRFLETDPIGYGDGVNWYSYVGNNPVNRIDHMGLSRQDIILLACGMGCDLSGMGVNPAQPIANTALTNNHLDIYEVGNIWRHNTDPNLIVTADASKLTVEQLRDFSGPKNTAPGNVVGTDWLVYGSVTLQQKDGNITLLPDHYDFLPHGSFFNTDLNTFGRNVHTFGGFINASQWFTSVGTDFTIKFIGSPNVVRH